MDTPFFLTIRLPIRFAYHVKCQMENVPRKAINISLEGSMKFQKRKREAEKSFECINRS